VNTNPLQAPFPQLLCQEDCWSNILSKRWSGATVKKRGMLSPKARKQVGTVLERLPSEMGWNYHVITSFLKEEHKEKNMLCHKKKLLLRLRERPEKFIKGTIAKCTDVLKTHALYCSGVTDRTSLCT
uniref:Uncharacterized protein n=1 Tax=Apteryx owenii TaxID=8824 RepID=A0A8B9Q9R8_APTOW